MNLQRIVHNVRRAMPWLTTSILFALGAVRPPVLHGQAEPAREPEGRPRPTGEIAERITTAGNTDDDSERLRILGRIRSTPGLDPRLAADVDRMATAVEKWVSSPFLPYFSREVRDTLDFDFGVSRDSPLYPLTCLYRGRMLVWNTLEMGNVINNPELRRKYLDKAVENFRVFRKAHPENRIARMYLGEAIPWKKPLAGMENAPRWAALQRENLERLTDVILWWIERRMQPGGQYGGGWGDDCEMWRWWTPVLLGFDHPKISAAQARFSRALMSQDHMKRGYTTRRSDVEHTAEDSADAITPMMHLDPENPEWKQRALRLAEFMRDRWTGRNRRGFLQFRSTYFTVDRVDETPSRACDTVYHPRAVQPALLLWQRTGDKQLESLFATWMETWVDAAARAERGKPTGIVPSAIRWPDGGIGGVSPDWWDPRNHGEPTLYRWPSALGMLNDTLLLTYHMTGNEKYLQPLRSMAAIRLRYLEQSPGTSPAPGSVDWCAERLGLLAPTLAKFRELTGRREFDALLTREGRAVDASRADDRERITRKLEASARSLRVNFEGYTSEVRWTDRVLRFPALFGADMMFRHAVAGFHTPDPGLVYRLVTGDPGSSGYFPMNAVRWRTPPTNIAALVTESKTDRFSAELFHFGPEPRSMEADLYLLSEGRYTLVLSTRPNGTERPVEIDRRELQVEGRVTHVSFTLPSRQLAILRVARRPSFPSVEALPKQRGLADPFARLDGGRVSKREDWPAQREYLKALLAHYQYGHMPPRPKKLAVEFLGSRERFDGAAVEESLRLTVRRNGRAASMRFGVLRPSRAGRFPLIIKNSNYLFDLDHLSDDRRERYAREGRIETEAAIFREAIRRGYVICKYLRTDLAADHKDNRETGVFPLYPEYDWGTIAVWAWGYQLVIDALIERSFVDEKRVVVTGHSRGGKTALCGGIFDERIALTAPNSSGAGGTASWRFFADGKRRQTIRVHVDRHAYWWNPRLLDFADREDKLPFDAHTAKLLVAPRGLLNTHALGDEWASPYGTQLTYQAAQIVFDWLGAPEHQGIHWRPGGHAQGPEDWKALLDFADRYFHARKTPRRFDVLPYPDAPEPIDWAAPSSAAAPRPPNFLIILCDNLGYGDIEPYGSKVHRTPHLTRMAAEGLRFTHFYASAGVCTPSRASLLTGCYAQRVGLGEPKPDGIVLRPVSPNGLHPDEDTMAEILKKQGYATGLIGKWHLGDQPPFLPTRQGFDSFFGIPYSDDMTQDKRPERWPPLPLMQDERVVEAPTDRNELTRRYTERALEFIESNRGRPFFLLLSHAMPGSTKTPYASAAFRGKSRNAAWGDAVEEIDWSTGRILSRLRELKLDRETLVVWTSDNGAPIRPGIGSGSNGPLFGRGYTTAEGAFRVPAIFWQPGAVPANRECHEMATLMDLVPTFAALAGAASLSSERVIDGQDIRPLILGEQDARSPHEVFYYYQGRQLQAIRSGRWKLFVPLAKPVRHPYHRGPGPSPPLLFDVVGDVGCARDVADQHPDVVAALFAHARRARQVLGDTDRSGSEQRAVGRVDNPSPRVLTDSR